MRGIGQGIFGGVLTGKSGNWFAEQETPEAFLIVTEPWMGGGIVAAGETVLHDNVMIGD